MNLPRAVAGVCGSLAVLAVVLSAQGPSRGSAPTPTTPAPAPPGPNVPGTAPGQSPTFKVTVDLVTTDVLVRDNKGNFIPDLKKNDFEVYEDGVLQDISSMTVVTGGRVTNALLPPAAPAPEGIILPTVKPRNDVSGRIFVFFVDDQHLRFDSTARVRQLFEKFAKELIHDGDMFGMVSSGPSSISMQMTYDKNRFMEMIKKITGNELKPFEIINGTSGPGGPTEVRYRAHVAFATVDETLQNLEQVHNRRKSLIYVSDGYDFTPFQDARFGLMPTDSPFAQNQSLVAVNQASGQGTGGVGGQSNPGFSPDKQNEEFADADLVRELFDLTRTANRANVTIYSIDPRGLAGPLSDEEDNVDPQQWQDFIRKSQESLKTLAEETGGYAIVNMNDFSKGIRRIDAETSDYYVLGFYSKNPDPFRKNRRLEIKVKRPDVQVWFRKEYSLKPLPSPAAASTKK
jgi:VWFA-related protein